jgi:hypothetical protein
MLGYNPFYFRTIRQCVIAFGSLFKDLVMVKYNLDTQAEVSRLTVPLSYAGKENFITRLLDNPLGGKAVEITLPRASFEITNYAYDPSRKLSTYNYITVPGVNGSASQQFQSVPWNIDFELDLYVRNVEDGNQLVEQILPFFTPDYTVAINYIPSMGVVRNAPLILNSVQCSTQYEGDAKEQERIIIWTLGFTMQAQFFGPISTGNLITSVNTNFYIDDTLGGAGLPSTLEITVANTGFGNFQLNEPVYEGSNLPDATAIGFVSGWSNTTHVLALANVSGSFTYPGNVVGANSGAVWAIQTLSDDVKMAVVTVTPSPNTANANSDFGFTTTITEAPKTF